MRRALQCLCLAGVLTLALTPARPVTAVELWCSAVCTSSAPCSSSCWDNGSSTCGEYGLCCPGTSRQYVGLEYGPWYADGAQVCTRVVDTWFIYCHYDVTYCTCQAHSVYRKYKHTDCNGTIWYTSEYLGEERQCVPPEQGIVIDTFSSAFCSAETGCEDV